MGVWSMLFGGSALETAQPAEATEADFRRRWVLARRLRRIGRRAGRFATFADHLAHAIEHGIRPDGIPSTHAEEARAVFLLAKFVRGRGLRRVAAELMMLFVELNLLASQAAA